MDDSDTPASSLQIGPQDGCHPGGSVERRVTPLPSVADENENQLDGDGPAALTGSGSAMGRATVFDQDSLNNNESCLSGCEVAPGETAEHSPSEGPKDGQSSLAQDKKTPGKRSPRTKRGSPKNLPPGTAFKLSYYPLTKSTFLLALLLSVLFAAASVGPTVCVFTRSQSVAESWRFSLLPL